MIWQDLVFTFGSLIFSLALISSVKVKEKPTTEQLAFLKYRQIQVNWF